MSYITFQLPAGPKNLTPLFPAIDFKGVDEYFIQLKNKGDNSILLTTNRYNRGCCCNEDNIRIFFVNYAGGIDAINLKLMAKETDIKSISWKKPLKYPLEKWDGGVQRSSVTGRVNVLAQTDCYSENDTDWLEELKATPNAWMQWTGTQGQGDDYLPIVVEDGKFVKRKVGERYYYPFVLQFSMANELFILRN